MGLEIEPIEYGDHISRHDVYQPVYRVDFWRQFEPQPGEDPALMGWQRESYRVHGARSVRGVRAWAESNGGSREFVIWVELGPSDDRMIIRVEGVDPTNPTQDSQAE